MDRSDSLWKLRALIASLILIALAGPGWHSESGRSVTVWFDDSMSMQAREEEGTRAELGIKALFEHMRADGVTEIELRSLTDPLQSTRLTPNVEDAAYEEVRAWLSAHKPGENSRLPQLPLPAGEHWLVTDGAIEGLQPWLEIAQIKKLIQVGSKSENSAVTLIALRRSLSQSLQGNGLVTVSNLGRREVTRKLRVEAGGEPLGEWSLVLPPGQSLVQSFNFRLDYVSTITANLLPGMTESDDALPQDDDLSLQLPESAWRQAIELAGDCGAAVGATLEAIPGVTTEAEKDIKPALTLACTKTMPVASNPVIWINRAGESQPISAAPVWHDPSGPLGELLLEKDSLRAFEMHRDTRGEALLTAGEKTLISLQRTPVVMLEVRLDMSSPALTRRPEFPLLVSRLLEFVMDRELLSEQYTECRMLSESRIVPGSLPASGTLPSDGEDRVVKNFNLWLIAFALILILYDTILIVRRSHDPVLTPQRVRSMK